MITQTIKNNAFFRQLLFLGILILIGITIIDQLAFFLGSFLGAITLYIIVRKWAFRLIDHYRWRPWVTSLLFIAVASILLSAIGYVVFKVIASEIPSVDKSHILQEMNSTLAEINKRLNMNIVPENVLHGSSGILTSIGSTIFNTTYSFAANILMMMVILYFMIAHGRKMEETLIRYVPFKEESLKMIQEEATSVIYGNAVGIPAVMIAQTIAAAVVYWLLGLNNALFWAFLTGLCGLIPMVGTVLVTIPLAGYFIVNGEIWTGIILALCGLLIIANVDNVVRIVLMKKMANTPPLIIILGVILGIPLFGFWGIIFGPLLISCFLLLVKIYYAEYNLLSPAKRSDQLSDLTNDSCPDPGKE